MVSFSEKPIDAVNTMAMTASESAVGPLLAHLVERSRLSAKDLDELRELIDQKSEEEDS